MEHLWPARPQGIYVGGFRGANLQRRWRGMQAASASIYGSSGLTGMRLFVDPVRPCCGPASSSMCGMALPGVVYRNNSRVSEHHEPYCVNPAYAGLHRGPATELGDGWKMNGSSFLFRQPVVRILSLRKELERRMRHGHILFCKGPL